MSLYSLVPQAYRDAFDERDLEKIDQILEHDDYSPMRDQIFNAFGVPPSRVRVIVLGMDPYPTRGMAIGRSFATCGPFPPSLKNISSTLDKPLKLANLTEWCVQGVLLLNTAFTVRVGDSGSHISLWKPVTKRLVGFLTNLPQKITWICMGRHAINTVVPPDHHVKLSCSHPSPLSFAKKCGPFPSFREAKIFQKAAKESGVNF